MMKTIDKLKQIIAEYDDLDINKINTKHRLVNDFGFVNRHIVPFIIVLRRHAVKALIIQGGEQYFALINNSRKALRVNAITTKVERKHFTDQINVFKCVSCNLGNIFSYLLLFHCCAPFCQNNYCRIVILFFRIQVIETPTNRVFVDVL
mgnify:CR=1 FL=1